MIDHEMRIEHISSMIIAGLMALFALCSWYFYMQLQPSAHYEPDSICYDRVARNFAQTGQLIDPLNPHNPPVYPLGYPLFLGFLYYLFGMHLSVVILAHIVLSLLSGLLLYRIANLLFGPYSALITTIIWFLHLGMFVYTQLVLSEIVLVTLCLLFWQQLLIFLKTGRILLLGSAGFLLGLSLIIKSIVLIFVPAFLLIVPGLVPGSWMKKLIAELFVIGMVALPVCAAMAYNGYHYRVWRISPQASVNLYHYYLPKVIARVEAISPEQAIEQRISCESSNLFDVQSWKKADDLLWYYLMNYPTTCIVVWCENVGKTMFGLFTTQLKKVFNRELTGMSCSFFNQSGTGFKKLAAYISEGTHLSIIMFIGWTELLCICIRYLLIIMSFYWWYHEREYVLSFLMGSFIISCLFITGFDGCFRFRIVLEPLFTLFAIQGLWCIIHVIRSRYVVTRSSVRV